MSEDRAATAAWSAYWRSGRTESCYRGPEPVAFDAFWAEVFGAAPPGARVLDLACGAGALLRRALAVRDDLVVTGVDLAEGAPAIAGATVRCGVPLEALPFADRAFDLLVSQFGFEYADRAPALAEAVRVLAPGGRLAFVLHNAEGPAIRDAAARAQRLAPFLGSGAVAARLADLGRAAASGGDLAAAEAAAVAAWTMRARAPDHDDTTAWALDWTGDMLKSWRRYPPAYLLENAATLTRELDLHAARLGAMVRAALDENALHALVHAMTTAGLAAVKATPLAFAGDPVAWRITATAQRAE